MSEEQKKEKLKFLMKNIEISKSGYAGVMPSGQIVDRREHPDAVPVQANKMFGIPKPKTIFKVGDKIDLQTSYSCDKGTFIRYEGNSVVWECALGGIYRSLLDQYDIVKIKKF